MITLTSALTYAVGGVTQETADYGAAASSGVFWVNPHGANNRLNAQMAYGTMRDSSFTASGRADLVPINIDLTSAAWSSGQVSGTLTPEQLTAIQTAVNNLRNILESFATSSGIMAGTQTPW